MAERIRTPLRDEYPHFQQLHTRWMDNDVYGHVNNVHYYSFFDTVVNRYLIGPGEMDFMRDNAKTTNFQMNLKVDGDKISYSQTTFLFICTCYSCLP